MRVRVMTSIVATIVAAVAITAQTAPNFAGTWVIDPDRTAAVSPPRAGGGGGGASTAGARGGGAVATLSGGSAAPPEYVITHTTGALTIVRALADGTQQKYVYKLDGTESVNVNGRTTQKTTSKAGGGTITTVGTQTVSTSAGDVTSQIREVRSLGKDGAMVVELTRTVEGSSRTVTQVFKKK